MVSVATPTECLRTVWRCGAVFCATFLCSRGKQHYRESELWCLSDPCLILSRTINAKE